MQKFVSCVFMLSMLFYCPLRAAATELEIGTLVVLNSMGEPEPGLAKNWKQVEDKIVFELQEGVDGEALKEKIAERLSHVKVDWDGQYLSLGGIPAAALFEQLSFTVLQGESDPLASLTGLGDSVATLSFPEAGGSIRASKPMPDSLKIRKVQTPAEPRNFMQGKIISVEKGDFPHVSLTLEIVSRTEKKKSKRHIKQGKLKAKKWKGPVLFIRDGMGIDLRNEKNQKNLCANYLHEGDSIRFVPLFKDKRLVGLDLIERL